MAGSIGFRGAKGAAAVLALGSGALLLAAFAFQYIGGYVPCELCVWQRWAHGAVLVLALLALVLPRFLCRVGLWLALIALVTGIAVALFHVGVEQHWWEGLPSCVGPAFGAASVDDLAAQLAAAPAVRCDAVQWQFLGLSMAAWNAVASLLLAVVAVGLESWSRRRRHGRSF